MTRRRPSPPAPLGRHFDALHPEVGEHPIDVLVARVPKIAARTRKLMRLADKIRNQVSDRAAFIRYEDLRLLQQTERSEMYFNAGVEHGLVRGRAESLAVSAMSTPEARELARTVYVRALKMERVQVVAVLLELARGLVLGRRVPRPRRRSPRIASRGNA